MTKIYIKTYGCALNQSDSELMAGLLKESKFEIVNDPEDAFVIIINTCTVKGKTETKFFNYLEKTKEKYSYKKIIITGCIPQTDPGKLKGYSLLGTSQLTNIVQLVEETINDNPMAMLTKEQLPRLNLSKIRKNPAIEIIPISEGCLGSPCAYCKVKSARGRLRSYPKEEIVKLSRQADLIVIDRNISVGSEGALFSEVKAALYDKSDAKVYGFIAGLGGKDVPYYDVEIICKKAIDGKAQGYEWYGLEEA